MSEDNPLLRGTQASVHQRAAAIHREEAKTRAEKGHLGVKQHEAAAKAHEKVVAAIAGGKKSFDVQRAQREADSKSTMAAAMGGRHGLSEAMSEIKRDEQGRFASG